MRWQNKVSATELLWAWSIYEVQKEDTGTLEDIGILAGATWATAGLWAPELRTALRVGATAAIAPYLVPVGAAMFVPLAIGTGVSYAIGGGQGVKDYYEFLTTIPEEGLRFGESIDVITEEVIAPQVEAASHGFNWVMTGVSNWVDRQLQEAQRGLPSW